MSKWLVALFFTGGWALVIAGFVMAGMLVAGALPLTSPWSLLLVGAPLAAGWSAVAGILNHPANGWLWNCGKG